MRVVKTAIEVAVVLLGWALGGTFGWATVAYALGVGVVVQLAARRLAPAMAAPAPASSARTIPAAAA
ncbi:hypothetical protein [Xylanimonas sp. McL0601]|uniref:hypothetical protein n=1 Tax=Xylanimonas sp. McL0601 TaxID=3414739 RepID=UPI003CF95426